MKQGLLPRRLPLALVRLGLRFPRAVLVGAGLAWVLTAALMSQVRVETDILSLVPEHNPVVQGFKTTIERFGSVDTLLVVLRLEPDQELEPVVAYADALADSLREWDLIDWVEYRLEDPTQTVLPLLNRTTLLLEPDQVRELMVRLDEEHLPGQADMRLQLEGNGVSAPVRRIVRDGDTAVIVQGDEITVDDDADARAVGLRRIEGAGGQRCEGHLLFASERLLLVVDLFVVGDVVTVIRRAREDGH